MYLTKHLIIPQKGTLTVLKDTRIRPRNEITISPSPPDYILNYDTLTLTRKQAFRTHKLLLRNNFNCVGKSDEMVYYAKPNIKHPIVYTHIKHEK